jgi:hypothetical protein
VFHPQSSSKGRICFDDYAMLLAEGRERRPCIKGVNFDLVDSREASGVRVDQLLELHTVSAQTVDRRQVVEMAINAHMLDTIITHASSPHLPIFNCIFNGPPAL